MAPWQLIPSAFQPIVTNFLGLHRLQSPSDRQRPFLVTRVPHHPPRSSELVVRIQGKVVAVELGPLGNWSRRTDTASCARAVKSVTLGCQDPNLQAWLDTLTALNELRQGIRHLVCQTPQVASNAAIKHLPVAEDTVLKFEHRVFQRRGPFRSVPDIFDANHLLQEVTPQWTITEPLPVFRATAEPPVLDALDPTLIQVGDFVDVSATFSLTPAPTFNDDDQEAAAEDDEGEDDNAGPILDFIPPSTVSGDTEMATGSA
ncbi:hypothetical protein M407DRAFT_31345 [Tulasnella calospora MUT 4182]|uniref:Uncharacterized protein n=1 Tax=Tulasnella calospora MUT 4182 TaxID=1051891 RepID=A0A0C3LBW2_9AGAM|nr:hypothetical protein M407DRAFT_31345 [Tulasnella calospora MUT 4182]